MTVYRTIVLLILACLGCRPLSNKVHPVTLECGDDFMANDNAWYRVETSAGTLLAKDEFEVLGLVDGTWQAQHISSRGCFNTPLHQEWIVRSVKQKESRLITEAGMVDSSSHRLRLEPNTSNNVRLTCPTKPLNSINLTFDQILRLEGSNSTRLGVSYELYDANSKNPILQSNWLLGTQSLPLVSGLLADGSYRLKFKIQDLRQDQIRDHECKVDLDNTPPQADVDRSHLNLDTAESKDYFVIARQEQLRFKASTVTNDDIEVEYCFLPIEEVSLSNAHDCVAHKIRTASIGEPISPSTNAGIWELRFNAVDVAGNQSGWKKVAPILYADSSTMQKIKLESRSEMLQTEISRVYGIFDLLYKAFANYSLWKTLATEYERNKTKDAIVSLFYAAHIGMNNYSQFISLADKTNNMILTPDGERMITGLYNGDIQIFDMRSKKLISTLEGHWASVSSFSLSPDNRILVSGNFDQTIKVWDLETSRMLTEIPCCEGEFIRLGLSPDKQSIVSSSWSRAVKIWSIDGTLKKTITNASEPNFHQDVIMSLKISPDGKYFATGSWDRTVRLWDMATGAFIRKMSTDHGDGVNDIGFSLDSQFLLSAGKDGQILVHKVADGSLQRRLASLSASVTSIDVGAQHVISGSLDNAIRVWNLDTAQLIDAPLKVEYFGMDDVAISAAGNVYASTGNTSIIRVWGSVGRNDFVQELTGHAVNSSIRSLAFDENQQRIFSGGSDGKIIAWDLKTGAGSVVDQADTIYDMKLSPQKDYLYASSKDGRLRRYSLGSLSVEAPVFERSGAWLFSMAFDPLTSQIYLGTWDGYILAPKGSEISSETKVSVGWAKLMFEPESKKLLLLSRDKYLGLYDPTSMQVTHRIQFSEALISGYPARDGKTAFVGLWNGLVASVDLASFKENYHFDAEGGIVWDLFESSTTGYLVTSNNDGKVRIWNTEEQKVVGVPLIVSSKATRTMFYSQKDGLLITGDDDGVVKVWNLPLTRDVEALKKMVCAGAGDVLRSSWFIEKYKAQLQNLCDAP